MNKVQDGFVAFGDSYKPVTISSNREQFASISFVGDQVIVRALNGARLQVNNESDDSLSFTLTPAVAKPLAAEPDARAQAAPEIKGNL